MNACLLNQRGKGLGLMFVALLVGGVLAPVLNTERQRVAQAVDEREGDGDLLVVVRLQHHVRLRRVRQPTCTRKQHIIGTSAYMRNTIDIIHI